MSILEGFDKNNEIESRLDILKMGARYLGTDFKISEAFSADRVHAQLPSFYIKHGKAKEAEDAIKWWQSLPQELKNKHDR